VTVTATPPAPSLPTSVTPSEQNTVSLFDLLLVLVKYRKTIGGITASLARLQARPAAVPETVFI